MAAALDQAELRNRIAYAARDLLREYDRLGFLPGYELRLFRELLAQLR